jgi:hypothetical protein
MSGLVATMAAIERRAKDDEDDETKETSLETQKQRGNLDLNAGDEGETVLCVFRIGTYSIYSIKETKRSHRGPVASETVWHCVKAKRCEERPCGNG